MTRPTKEDVDDALLWIERSMQPDDDVDGYHQVLAAEVLALREELARALLPHWPLDVGTPTEWHVKGQVEWLVVDPRVEVSVLVTPDKRMHVALTPKPAEPPSSWSATYDTEAVDALLEAWDNRPFAEDQDRIVQPFVAAVRASREPKLKASAGT